MLGFFAFLAVLGTIGFLFFNRQTKRAKHIDYLNDYSRTERPKLSNTRRQLVDMKSLSGRTFLDRVMNKWLGLLNLLGKNGEIKLIVFFAVLLFGAKFFNDTFLQTNYIYIAVIFVVVASFFGYNWLHSKQQKAFEETFPVALNMLTSAVSAGESITQAISYVGDVLEGRVAEEFRIMGKRLQLGESPEEVFRKSCVRFPYPTFFFFVTLSCLGLYKILAIRSGTFSFSISLSTVKFIIPVAKIIKSTTHEIRYFLSSLSLLKIGAALTMGGASVPRTKTFKLSFSKI